MTKNRELALDQKLAREAQSLVAMAFRNGPIEDVHAGMDCPTCSGRPEYSHITQDEMKRIMKHAVDKLYALLWIREHCPDVYGHVVQAGNLYTHEWDLPERSREEIELLAQFAERLGSAAPARSPATKKSKLTASVSRKR
jgi:hypothetical protein